MRRVAPPTISDGDKTPKMRYLELKYGTPIEELLLSGSLRAIEHRLNGEVDHTTLCRWIKRFKLRYSKNNLPSCEFCLHHHVCCDEGLCNLLVELELFDLLPYKKEALYVDERAD